MYRKQIVDEQSVTFTYKDYKAKGERKVMTLSHAELIRSFTQHILPKRFVKIRPGGEPHFGYLSSTWKREKLIDLQEKLKVKPAERACKSMHRKCPCCKIGNLVRIETFDNLDPSNWWKSSVSQVPVPHKS